MKIRKGDIVKTKYGIGIVRATKSWWLCKGGIDVGLRKDGFGATGTILSKDDDVIEVIQKREDIQNWWEWL